MKIDEIFEHIGNFGRYHQILYVLVFLAGIPNALMLMHFVFSHYEVDFHCQLPQSLLNLTINGTMTYNELLNYTIPMEKNSEGGIVRSQCKMYDLNFSSSDWMSHQLNTTLTDCKYGYAFNFEDGQYTAIAEFEMVCDRSWMVPLAVSGVQAGMALGSFSGSLGDRFGRRPIFLAACVAQVVFTVFASFSWDYYSYAIANFFGGCAQLVNFVIAFVLASEVIAVGWRNFIAISSFFAFGLGICMEAALAYFFRQWRHFLWAISVFSTILYLPSFWLLPESARWLMIRGRKEEGVAELKKMAKQNKCKFDVDEFVKTKMIDVQEENEQKATIIQTFKVLLGTKLRKRFMSVCFIWIITGLAYYAISLYSTSFSKDRFVNTLLIGVSEFPAQFLAYFAAKYSGRPRAAFFLMFACGTSSLLLPFISAPEVAILRTLVAMVGKGSISAIFYVAYFLSAETTPTLQRSSSISIASFCARVGGFCAPFLAYLGKSSPLFPNLLMGFTVLAAGFLCIFFVPETRGVPLPDSTEEALSNKRRYSKALSEKQSLPNLRPIYLTLTQNVFAIYGLKLCRNLAPGSSGKGEKRSVAL